VSFGDFRYDFRSVGKLISRHCMGGVIEVYKVKPVKYLKNIKNFSITINIKISILK